MEIGISCQLFNRSLTTSDIKEYLTLRYINQKNSFSYRGLIYYRNKGNKNCVANY